MALAQDPPASAPPDSKSLSLVKGFPVEYPAAAQTANIQGFVVLKVTVGENGDVETADIVSGDPVLCAAASSAAKQWKFQPFIRNGKAIDVSTTIQLKFAIDDGKCTNGLRQATVTTPFDQSLVVAEKDLKQYVCKKVTPVPGQIAQAARVQGDVVTVVVIGKDGTVQNMKILSGPPLLRQSAIDALKQWRFRPYVVSNQPVVVDTVITVSF